MDVYQSRQIGHAYRAVDHVAQEAQLQRQATRDEITRLHDRIDRLVLVTESIWQLLAESAGLTEDDLDRRVVQLDGADGSQDGRRTRAPVPCACGAKVSPRMGHCQFCGEPSPVHSSFDAI